MATRSALPAASGAEVGDVLKFALWYARRGWSVLPCRPGRKEPLSPHGCRDATTDTDTIRGWWRCWPTANVGIATGRASGLLVLDVDGTEGEDSLAALVADHGAMPHTVEALTPGGGRHIYFRYPSGRPVRCATRLGGWPGLDVRADGGYVIAPPSGHPSGRCYVWEVSSEPDTTTLAEPPAWLLALAAGKADLFPHNGHRTGPIPGAITEGLRNNTLTSLAGSLRRRGLSEGVIERALLAVNASQCAPPLPAAEVKRISRSVGRYPAPAPGEGELSRDYAHAAELARLFMDRYRWSVHRGSWMAYDGGVWRPVPEEAVAKQASDALRREYAALLAAATDKAAVLDLTKKVAEACTYARVTGGLAFLKGWGGVLTLAEEWDRDTWLLNVRNGTIDLRTCTLRPHDPRDLLTKQAPVEFDPRAEVAGGKWEAHITKFLPDANVRRQVQRDLGGALPGAVLDEALPIWWGTGGNGKTTTVRTILRLLGDYACRAAPELLVQSKYDRHPTEIADLCGKRLVFSVEMDKAKHLAEALVKDLTGGDRKKARYMRQDFFEFDQTFSIILVCNQKPIVTGTDQGLWRRLRLIPWTYQVKPGERKEQDEVIAELLTEGSAILNWLLDGLRDRQQETFWVADEVKAVTEAYRAEMDLLADFLRERCVLGPRYYVAKGELYEAYTAWCERNHERPLPKRDFTSRLADRGVGETRDKRTRYYVGIGVVTDGDRLSVSPLAKTNFGDYMETVSSSVTSDEADPPRGDRHY